MAGRHRSGHARHDPGSRGKHSGQDAVRTSLAAAKFLQAGHCCPSMRGAVADFGRSSLPRRTSRLAATSLHVNQRMGPITCGKLHTKFAFRRKSFPGERTYFDNQSRLNLLIQCRTGMPSLHLHVTKHHPRVVRSASGYSGRRTRISSDEDVDGRNDSRSPSTSIS